jgi:hypothetical protein
MATVINIGIDPRRHAELQRLLGAGLKGAGNQAAQAAVSRTITTGRALIARRIGEEVYLRIGDIKKTISVKRGSFKDPTGEIRLTRRASWLSQFASSHQRSAAARKIGRGLFSKVRPAGGITVKVRKNPTSKYPATETFRHAFWAVTPHSMHLGIFERVGLKRAMKSGRYQGQVREVMRRRKGPSALGVFLNARGEGGAATVAEEVTQKMSDALEKNLASQIDRFLNPAKP